MPKLPRIAEADDHMDVSNDGEGKENNSQMIKEADISYSDLDVLTDLGEGLFFRVF